MINISHVGEIHNSNGNYGPCEIIKDLGKINGYEKVRVRFLNTMNEYDFFYINVKRGEIRDTKAIIPIGAILDSNCSGKFIVLEDLGMIGKYRGARIKFIKTGNIYDVLWDNAKKGKAKDPDNFNNKISDTIYESNYYGEFIIIDDYGLFGNNSSRDVKIKFIRTGSECIVEYKSVLCGNVKDPAFENAFEARKVLGPRRMRDINYSLKRIWNGIKQRCYNINDNSYETYGAKGVKMCDEWLNFETFKHDAQLLPGWINKYNDPLMYHIDKDLLQYNIPSHEKVYSKNTCIWLHRDINSGIINGYTDEYYDYGNDIYSIKDEFYIVPLLNYCNNYGPFDCYNAAANMLNYCYNRFNTNISIDVPYMHPSDVIGHYLDAREMCIINNK